MTNHKMDIALPRLIELLGERLYSRRDVAVRELVVNANDALTAAKNQGEADAALKIHIVPEPTKGKLTIKDTGMGMTEEDVIKNLSTIGHSGTADLRRALQENNPALAQRLIGTFGLGLLSAFVVAEDVVIESRSRIPGSQAVRWACSGDVEYSLEPCQKNDFGTDVILKLKTSFGDLAHEAKIKALVKRYADFISYPIYMGLRTGDQINTVDGPWHNDDPPTLYEDYVIERYCKGEDATPKPLAIFPICVENDREFPDCKAYGVLFVPRYIDAMDRDAGIVDLYVQRAFVRSGVEGVLPSWARFVRGLIDSPSINLTVNREAPVEDEKLASLQKLLEKELSHQVAQLATDDTKKFKEVALRHDFLLKKAATESKPFFDAVADKLLFSTSHSDKLTNLRDYLNRARRERPEDANTIFYFRGGASPAQYRELFTERMIEVLEVASDADEEVLTKYGSVHGIDVRELATGAETLFEPPDRAIEWEELVAAYREWINPGVKAVAVKFNPNHIPAIVVRENNQGGIQAVKGLVEFLKDQDVPQVALANLQAIVAKEECDPGIHSGTLYLNTANPIIKKLNDLLNVNTKTTTDAMHEIFHNARLFAQEPMDSDMMKHIYETSNLTIDRLLQLVETVRSLEANNRKVQEELRTTITERNQLKQRIEELH